MKKVIVGIVLVLCAAVIVYRIEQRAVKSAKAIDEAALSDSEEIMRGMNAYFDRKNGPLVLHNDELRLKNDQLRYDIAGLEGKPRNRARIEKDLAIIENDKLLMSLSDPSAPMLDPYQVEARIKEHNQKYPSDQLADISDFNRKMEGFQSRLKAVVKEGNEKLRNLPSK